MMIFERSSIEKTAGSCVKETGRLLTGYYLVITLL